MERSRIVVVALTRALAVVATVAVSAWFDVSAADAGVGAPPEEIGRQACLNAAMHIDDILRQGTAFLEATDRFVAAQRAAYPTRLVLDGSRPQDSETQAQWEAAFRDAFTYSWLGLSRLGAAPRSGPNDGLQDSDNYVRSVQADLERFRSPCGSEGPSACRRMMQRGDQAIASITTVFVPARTFANGVFPLIRQSTPGALYGGVPALLDALASSIRANGRKATDRVATYRSAEKRCAKAMRMSWPLPTVPARP